MIAPPDLQRRLSAFLDDEMSLRAPDSVVSDVLAAVGRTRRRPAWRIPERYVPMTVTMRLAVVPRAVIYLFILVLLVTMVAAGGLVVGSFRQAAVTLPPPFGPAANGLLAFDADGDIWVVEADGSHPRRLTTSSAIEHGPAWSRDGTQIAYWSQVQHGGPSGLIVTSADGSDPRTIATDPEGRTSLQFLDWSPDGARITYSLGSSLDPITLDERVFVAATDGTGARQVGDPDLIARQPSWSPDGTLIAFSGSASDGAIADSYYPGQGIYLMAPDGTDVRRLSEVGATQTYEFYRAEWSPEENRLATNVNGAIWDLAADGTGEAPIAGSSSGSLIPRWSPDGTSILYVSLDSSHLYTIPVAGGAATDLGNPGSGHVWSPDGTRVATFNPWRLVLLDSRTGGVVTEVGIGDQSYPAIHHYPSWQRLAVDD